MGKTIADYQTIQHNFNQRVSQQYQLPLETPSEGESVLVSSGPIKISMDLQHGEVVSITINCYEDNNPAWDEVFEGFEQGMNWSSISFFNAYRKAVNERQTVSATAHGIQAVHTSRPNDLTVVLTRVGK